MADDDKTPEDIACEKCTALWNTIAENLGTAAIERSIHAANVFDARTACGIAEFATAAHWQATGIDDTATLENLMRPKISLNDTEKS